MKPFFIFLALILALAACSPAAAPTPVDLNSLLIQPADLPEGITAGQTGTILPELFSEVTAPDEFAHQTFLNDGSPAGEVAILHYAKEDVMFEVLDDVVRKMPRENRRGIMSIGDASWLVTSDEAGSEYSELAFQRCQWVGYIRLPGISNSEPIIAYGKNLDQRLLQTFCPSVQGG